MTGAIALAAALLGAQTPAGPRAPIKRSTPLADALPIIEQLPTQVPAALKGKSAAALATAWPAWVAERSANIRSRLARGDEDSVVNFMLFGTSFTSERRATEADMALVNGKPAGADLLDRRRDALLAGIGAPNANERLRLVRTVIERAGVSMSGPAGRADARRFLSRIEMRMLGEIDRYRAALVAAERANDNQAEFNAFTAYYRDRGLASDTSVMANYSVDRALATVAVHVPPALAHVRRVAIVGPGLDFSDKGASEAYDYYPLQTLQPFGVMDSLIRLGLADRSDLRVVTLDISPRVNAHIRGAVAAVAAGRPYVVQLPLERDTAAHQWRPEFKAYWTAFGSRVGDQVPPLQPPPNVTNVDYRAVRIRPDIVKAVSTEDLNIVFERLEPAAGQGFDLMVATNILVYYDPFEQAIAMANIARMLRPGGLFVTNTPVYPTPPMADIRELFTPVRHDMTESVDPMFWYERR